MRLSTITSNFSGVYIWADFSVSLPICFCSGHHQLIEQRYTTFFFCGDALDGSLRLLLLRFAGDAADTFVFLSAAVSVYCQMTRE